MESGGTAAGRSEGLPCLSDAGSLLTSTLVEGAATASCLERMRRAVCVKASGSRGFSVSARSGAIGASAIGKVVVEAAELLLEAIPLLDKPGTNVARLTELTEKIVEAEGRSDDLHDEGLKQLFAKHRDNSPMQFYVGKEIYEALERVMDRFEDVANDISAIVIESV